MMYVDGKYLRVSLKFNMVEKQIFLVSRNICNLLDQSVFDGLMKILTN